MEPTAYLGQLQLNGQSMPISFSVRLSQAGEVEFEFAEIPLTKESKFLIDNHYTAKAYFTNYTLTGLSADGKKFSTDDLIFKNLGDSWTSQSGSLMKPSGVCSQAKINHKISEPVELPLIRMRLKDFQNFRQLRRQCKLGTVTVDGTDQAIAESDTITGYICIAADSKPADLSEWRAESEKLLEHIRQLLSFTSGCAVRAPIMEFFTGDECEVTTLTQIGQSLPKLQTVNYMNQQPILNAAVTSFFSPPVNIRNLYFAIEWFSMDATHNEVRLLNAMTALENLVASNLDDERAQILPVKDFEKIRKTLRQIIKKCTAKWSSAEEQKKSEVVVDLNEKLIDLNRRAIFQKIKALAAQWAVPLAGISDEQIKAAKQARDRIIHRGHYYEDDNNGQVDLWEHVTVARELIVRFLLTVIGYKGKYTTYIAGHNSVDFPPKIGIESVQA